MDIPAQETRSCSPFPKTVSEVHAWWMEYSVQSRGGQGTINLKTVEKVGNVYGVLQVVGEDNVSSQQCRQVIRLKSDIPVNHVVTQGVES
jgi:DNA gyrase subunit A